jgi:sucrose-6-phosphate hydrolase SacC (GH32 family)
MIPKVERFRHVVKSQDAKVFGRAALALRRYMISHDPQYPVYHFAGPESWINDANGVIYHQGTYHLFYQFDPIVDGQRSARCWGHAVSQDLVHWEDWPIALWPDSPHDRGGVYSGNVVIDDRNVPTALYTGNVAGHQETYGMLARSTDGWVTWQKQMVMHNDQRPNEHSPVHWDAQVWKDGDTWYQLIGGATDAEPPQGAAYLWSSPDLEQWMLRKPIHSGPPGAFWELPYLVPLGSAYVLLIGARRNPYWVGSYDKDKMTFTPDEPAWRWVDRGDYYAVNPHMVDDKGPGGSPRRIMHAWVRAPASPTAGVPYWQGMHSIPRVIALQGRRLIQQPIPELESLRGQEKSFGDRTIAPGTTVALEGISGDTLEIVASFRPGDAERFGLRVRVSPDGNTGVPIWYDARTGAFGIADVHAFSDLGPNEPVQMQVFVDRSVIEIYLNGSALTKVIFLDPKALGIEAFATGGSCTLTGGTVWRMGSMWSTARE